LHLHLRVELPDGRYTLVPEGGDEGVVEELQYVDVAQGLDQIQKGPRPTLLAKESPGSLTLSFKIMPLPCYDCAFTLLLTPKFGKESDLWVQLGGESVWWKERFS
jgi:hypothetical protein